MCKLGVYNQLPSLLPCTCVSNDVIGWVWSVVTIMTSVMSECVYLIFSLFLFRLLLSGDVELNPGPGNT